MGTLQTTIKLNDQFSKQLENINKAIRSTAKAMENLSLSQMSGIQRIKYEETKLAQLETKRATQSERMAGKIQLQNRALNQQRSAYNGIFDQLRVWGSRLRNILTMYYAIKSVAMTIGKAVGMSDKMSNADARLSLIANSKNSVKDIQAKSFGAAQRSSTDYLEFTKAVSKLGILAGDKFGNQDNIIKFVELMNKSFQISGAETSERNAAMLQLTQAIASNRLQGDEFRSVLENAPMVMDALAKSLGVGHKELKKLAKEGELTADVLIKAMFDASKQIESMYSKLPLTWERIWVRMKNVFTVAFMPIQKQLNRVFNSQKFARILDAISRGLVILGNVTAWALGKLIDLGSWMIDVWDKHKNVIKPILSIMALLIGATLAYCATVGLINLVKNALLGIAGVMKAITGLTLSTAGIWVAVAVLIIGLIYLIIHWINQATGSAYSATGFIAGAIMWLGSVIWNTIANLWNFWAIFLEYLVNAVKHPIYSLKRMFVNFAILVMDSFIAMSDGADTFATNLYNAILSAINWVIRGWNKLVDMLGEDVASKIGVSKGTEFTQRASLVYDFKQAKKALKNWADTSQPFDYLETTKLKHTDAIGNYYKGYTWGKNLEYKVASFGDFDLDLSKAQLTTLNGINDKLGEATNGLGDIAGNTGDTANNTGDIAKNTGNTNDYSYLRDWSYQKGLGSSIGYNIKIEQNNRNNIGNNMDLNRVVDAVRDAIIEGIYTQAEGVR